MTDQQQIAWHRHYTKDQIKALQQALNDATPPENRERGGTGIRVDGVFGPETLKALKRVQGYHPELTADGLAGDRTLAVLGLLTTNTFNDPQLPATIKGQNQARKTDLNVSPEETRQAMRDLQYAYSHPIELTAGREKPLRMVSPSAIVAAYPYIGVGQRALYTQEPSEYEEGLLSLLPVEQINSLSQEDLDVINAQLKDLEKKDPTMAADYQKFLDKRLDEILTAVNDHHNPRYRQITPKIYLKDYYKDKPENKFFELLSQVPSLQGFYLTNEELGNIKNNRTLDNGLVYWPDDGPGRISMPSIRIVPSWSAYASYANTPATVTSINKPKKVTLQPFKRGGRINYINLYK